MMITNTDNTNLRELLIKHCFSVFNTICILGLLAGGWKSGAICSVAILVIIFLNLPEVMRVFYKDAIYAVYVFVTLLTTLSYIYNGRDWYICFAGISYQLIPSLIYIFGAICGDLRVQDVTKPIFYNCIVLMLIGLFFYVFFPDFYFSHIGQSLDVFTWGIKDYRFGSYISNLSLGSMCTVCVSMFFVLWNELTKKTRIICFVAITMSLILTMQRSAWAVSVFITLLLLLFCTEGNALKKTKLIMILCGVLLVVWMSRELLFTDTQLKFFLARLSRLNFSKMSGERVEQWEAAWNIFLDNPWGIGVGAASHKAVKVGFGAINDGNYFRILAETGVWGLLTFLVLVIRALWHSFMTKNLCVTLILLAFCLQAIGTNVFDLFFSSFIFWFYLGYATYCRIINAE